MIYIWYSPLSCFKSVMESNPNIIILYNCDIGIPILLVNKKPLIQSTNNHMQNKFNDKFCIFLE